MIGFVSDRSDLADIYSAVDVVAIPSTAENLPNVLIEALAYGRAAVACDAVGIRDGVSHLETGYLAKHADPVDFAMGLNLVLNDKQLQIRMENASKILFNEQFTCEKENIRFVRFYRDVIYNFRKLDPNGTG